MSERCTVLFICTGNACRSQMAEALLRHLGAERFESLSAGSRPAGFVHPLAAASLKDLGIPSAGLTSKHWSEFAQRRIDICITVCDSASAECPVWPTQTVQVHWGLPDPAFFDAPEEQRLAFCRSVAETLRLRLQDLVRLPSASMSGDRLRAQLENMARKYPAPPPSAPRHTLSNHEE